jgi:hypothetical protein
VLPLPRAPPQMPAAAATPHVIRGTAPAVASIQHIDRYQLRRTTLQDFIRLHLLCAQPLLGLEPSASRVQMTAATIGHHTTARTCCTWPSCSSMRCFAAVASASRASSRSLSKRADSSIYRSKRRGPSSSDKIATYHCKQCSLRTLVCRMYQD